MANSFSLRTVYKCSFPISIRLRIEHAGLGARVRNAFNNRAVTASVGSIRLSMNIVFKRMTNARRYYLLMLISSTKMTFNSKSNDFGITMPMGRLGYTLFYSRWDGSITKTFGNALYYTRRGRKLPSKSSASVESLLSLLRIREQ